MNNNSLSIIFMLFIGSISSCSFGPVKSKSAKSIPEKSIASVDSTNVPILESSENLSIQDIVSILPAKKIDSIRSIAATSALGDEKLNKNDFSSDGIFTVIRDPRILEKIEENGFYLGSHFGLSNGNLNNEELFKKSSLYRSLSDVLAQDLKDIILMEKKAGLSVGPSMKNTGRIFNHLWFKTAMAHYELVGITNRLDRVFFNQNTCGEMRFIYRLSYEKLIDQEAKQLYSRLPMTLMVKYLIGLNPNENAVQRAEAEKTELLSLNESHQDTKWKEKLSNNWKSCYRYVDSWIRPSEVNTVDEFVHWAVSENGALGSPLLQKQNLKTVEVNLQGFRIPSTARPGLGGHANYLLRAFKKDESGEKLVPTYLENTPDVERINSKPELKKELISYINNIKQIERIDNGIFVLPEKFLATRAISYSPYGISRKENRLYDQILSFKDIKPVNFKNEPLDENKLFSSGIMEFTHSPSALIKRLNDMSCVGCHQGRAMAGFHFLGIDRSHSYQFNSLVFEGSGHFETELKRRSVFLHRLLPRSDGRRLRPPIKQEFSIAPPTDFDERGLPIYLPAGAGHYCGLNEKSAFSHWKCAEGFDCVSYEEAEGEKDLGKCLPRVRRSGDACLKSFITQESRNKDKINDLTKVISCGDSKNRLRYACREPKGGFPGGMCSPGSSSKTVCPEVGDQSREICGHFAGSGFSECILSVDKGDHTWQDCVERSATKSVRGLCDENHACRNDYVCVRSYNYEDRPFEGVCTPAYFLFQVRLDAHPILEESSIN